MDEIATYRPSKRRPIYILSVKLIDTYRNINKIYFENKAKRISELAEISRGGVNNDGYDDQNFDFIVKPDEVLLNRYVLRHRIGKGSFGQVVCAFDQTLQTEVAIKIIKSKRPFFDQAQTEINLLNIIQRTDPDDTNNLVRLLDTFVYKNHQCLVFEMLSYNLYELLSSTKFKGITLTLIRKFARQILRALLFLSSSNVDIVHCDLKPENILLRHPRHSLIKIIDFGSSCLRTHRTYTYIQSRFYRSPEILLGMQYDQRIDMWSLGCVLVEMHIGQPLFGGIDQHDQICRIVDVLGMPPVTFLEEAPEKKFQFFEKIMVLDDGRESPIPSEDTDATCVQWLPDMRSYYILKRVKREDSPPSRTLQEILGVSSGGPSGRRRDDPNHTETHYLEFLDLISKMLKYDPVERISPQQALQSAYITSIPLRTIGNSNNNSSSSNPNSNAQSLSFPLSFSQYSQSQDDSNAIGNNVYSSSSSNSLKRSSNTDHLPTSSPVTNSQQHHSDGVNNNNNNQLPGPGEDNHHTYNNNNNNNTQQVEYSVSRARVASPRSEDFQNQGITRIRSRSAPSSTSRHEPSSSSSSNNNNKGNNLTKAAAVTAPSSSSINKINSNSNNNNNNNNNSVETMDLFVREQIEQMRLDGSDKKIGIDARLLPTMAPYFTSALQIMTQQQQQQQQQQQASSKINKKLDGGGGDVRHVQKNSNRLDSE